MTLYKINPGKYRHIVTFQRNTAPKDRYGAQPTANWENVYTTRAGIYPISGKEIFEKITVDGEISHRVHIRYNPTIVINSQMRVLFGNRVFSIIAPPINFQERNDELQILCKEEE
jgi:SPP1 family predicted phage head-tail adaptor